MPITVGNILADILGAPHGSITMHQNVAVAEAILASCFDFSGPRNKIVYSDMNFPSVMYLWEAHKRVGARVHTVASDDGVIVDTQKMIDAIDETTLLVPMSHVLFRSAYIARRQGDHGEGAQGRRQGHSRRLPVGGHGSRRSHRRSASTSPSAAR
jgi:kynureninase